MMRDQLIYGLGRLAAVARQSEWAAGEREGLTPTQGEILRLLTARPKGMRPSAIAAAMNMTMATISDAVAALVAKEAVQKIAIPSDGRGVSVFLTRTGKTLARALQSGFEDVVSVLHERDQEAMLAVVSHAIRELQRTGKIVPQRQCTACRYFVRNAHPKSKSPHHCAFVDAAMADRDLRLDCPEHEAVHAKLALNTP
jgi:DNA-binding MarR family transcriptional regulator